MSTGAPKMGGKPQTMDTEAGGEQTPYESIKTTTEPPSKQSGTMGGDVPETTDDTSGIDSNRAQKTTENISYGQNVSESGMGGKTTTSSGSAHQEGGLGGTEADKELESGKNSRTVQGYSVKRDDHDYKIGA